MIVARLDITLIPKSALSVKILRKHINFADFKERWRKIRVFFIVFSGTKAIVVTETLVHGSLKVRTRILVPTTALSIPWKVIQRNMILKRGSCRGVERRLTLASFNGSKEWSSNTSWNWPSTSLKPETFICRLPSKCDSECLGCKFPICFCLMDLFF
jgi:hypothetical protein